MLVALRLLQGLSAGGEIGGGAVYLAEHAGNEHRGFKTSFLQLMGPLGILASTIQIFLIQRWLTAEEFQRWGWRVPFWISLLLLVLAFYIRKSLEETPVFLELSKQNQTQPQLLNNFKDREIRKRMLLLFFCVSSSGAILFFCVQVYTAIFLKTSIKLDSTLVDMLGIISTLALLPLTVFAGWLSDKIGRKPVILVGISLGALFIYPAFQLLAFLGNSYLAYKNPVTLLSLASILIFLFCLLALVVGPQTAILAELFPARNRNSAATLPHNLAAGWIGGLLPFSVTWLNQFWGDDLAGLWYPTIFLGLSGITAFYFFPESNTNRISD
jgi:MFS family permease